jgi:hypothetical protein
MIDFNQISDVKVLGINHRDAPDYVDAFIESCLYQGRDATDAELDLINENAEFVYDCVINYLY